jgi:hypothetical protein
MTTLRWLWLTLTVVTAACGGSDSNLGEACGEGTDRQFECGGMLHCTLGECDQSNNQYARFTCTEFCQQDSDCQALDPAGVCHPFHKQCHLSCSSDDDCPDRTRCGSDSTCVREDPPGFDCSP